MDTYEFITLNPFADKILLIASGLGIRRVAFGDFETVLESYPGAARISNPLLNDAGWQISGYLKGQVETFNIPLDIPTPPTYKTKVLNHIREIPYGTVETYQQVAQETGNPGAVRAVGNVCATNPVPIIIPCHRVIKKNGELGGYIGGSWFKEKLLYMEKLS